MISLRLLLSAALLAVAPLAGAGVADARPTVQGQAQSGLAEAPLTIRSRTGLHRFRVELAQTGEQQERGLMFRTRVAPNRGMLFPFPDARPASFWMKNTLVPLDMLFIRQDGTIARVAADTVPLSLDPVGVNEPVAAVLELAGGRTARLGIRAGDRVSWPGGPHR